MKKRIAPRVSDSEMQRVISDVYDIMNELIDNVSNRDFSKLNQSNKGQLNVVKSGKEYTIEVKTKDGWFELSSLMKRKTVKKGN